MNVQPLEIVIYGAEDLCPSCIHSPSSKETKEWLEAAIERKFPNQAISFRYVDIYAPKNEGDQLYTKKILNDDYFYPLVVANNKVIGEGNPSLKQVFKFIEDQGFQPSQSN